MRNFSIQWKITLLSAVGLFSAVVLLIGLSVYALQSTKGLVLAQTDKKIKEDAVQLVEGRAEAEVSRVTSYLHEARIRTSILAASLTAQKQYAEQNYLGSGILRRSLNSLVLQTAKSTPYALGVYSVMLPAALGHADDTYAGQGEDGGNESGRFSVYWSRNDKGELTLENLTEKDIKDSTANENGFAKNEWFNCSIRVHGPCLLNPYKDTSNKKELLMVTVTQPVVDGDNVLGVVGMDIALDSMQSAIKELDSQLFSGHGKAALISSEGIAVSVSDMPFVPGDSIAKKDPKLAEQLKGWLKQAKVQVNWQNDTLQLFIPVNNDGLPTWGMLLEIPGQDVLAAAHQISASLDQQISSAVSRQILTGGIVTLLVLLAMWLSANRIVAPMRMVVERLNEIASGDGDLTQRLQIQSNDEMGALARAFNLFLDKLRGTITQVVTAVDGTRDTAQQANYVSGQTRDRLQYQFREIDQVAAAFEEMHATSANIADRAGQAVDAADEAEHAAQQGKAVVEESLEAMDSLMRYISDAKPQVERLAENSNNINKILDVIKGIAEQTNLLALNAAIEAARAGEQGRGFAVVADEVRNLASRTQESVGQIHGVINELQTGTHHVVTAILGSHKQADETLHNVQQSVGVLEQITRSIAVIQDMNTHIAHAVQEQSKVSGDISSSVTNIRDVSSDITGMADTSAENAEKLNDLANQQQQLMSHFKV
ncbi:methyl-accepting chemotaxis protein [Tolumonas lignilytica]|uniref:methyl-accepting chemotaxis protein n=1 Tax=Tolumonas lignilytica TaxID=1283284 RepID=UPI0004649804|nr:methyl-accepting chemotaxis protein [Tolumonas lignilytica]